MNTIINFPNLSLHLEHVGQSFDVFGFRIAYYGICIALGMLAGLFVACKEAKRTGQNEETYIDFTIIAVITSVIGARIYYVIFEWDLYKDNLLKIFNIREGGLAIYGGIIVAILTAYLFSKKKKIHFGTFADVGVFGLIVGQIIGRWGNFFNREVFGGYTNNIFAMQIPLSEVRTGDVTTELMEHLVNIDGVSYIQVHPTFLYESLWNLGVFILMNILKKHKKYEGEILVLYLAGYGLGRWWIEAVRTDRLTIGNTGIAISELLSMIIFFGAVVFEVYMRVKLKKKSNGSRQ